MADARFWEFPQVVVQGYFHGFIGAKAIGPSGDYSDFIVETRRRPGGDLPLGLEPVQDQGCMRPQHPRVRHQRDG